MKFITRYYKQSNQTHANFSASGFPKTRHGALKGAVPRIAMNRHRMQDMPFCTYAKAIVFNAETGAMIYSMVWSGSQLRIVEYTEKSIRLVVAS